MTRKITILLVLLCGVFVFGNAQDGNGNLKITAKPKDMWEVGIHVGHHILTGDVDWNSDFGVGLHVRKALDYSFSVRLDAGYYRLNGTEDETIRRADAERWGFSSNWLPEYSTNLLAGDVTALLSLNAFRIGKTGKVNPYVFLGAGLASINVTAIDGDNEIDILDDEDRFFDDPWKVSPYATAGFGLGFKLAEKISLGIEHKVSMVVGRGGDLLDGAERFGNPGSFSETSANDLMQYTNLRLGIALGSTDDKSLPLWWVSPMDMLTEDLAEVKARPKLDLTDTDGDGVIDMIDQEVNSPKGAAVDTRGIALDSDGDGIADHKDKEPYSPPGYKIDSEGVAQIPEPPAPITENDVNRIVDAKIAGIKFPSPIPPYDWFFPMVNYDNNSYAIKNSEYAKLRQIATVMKQNPSIRVLAKGFTDRRASNCYNDVLSYNRAQAAIDYMVSKYGISRDRFVLNYGGENDTLVDTNGSSLANRRVEFQVAKGESTMGRPDCGVNNAGRGGSSFSGNKEAGY